MKGLRANASTAKKLRSEFHLLVKEPKNKDNYLEFLQHNILRNYKHMVVWNHPSMKKIRFQSSKRWIPNLHDEYMTNIPYGFSKTAYTNYIKDTL